MLFAGTSVNGSEENTVFWAKAVPVKRSEPMRAKKKDRIEKVGKYWTERKERCAM